MRAKYEFLRVEAIAAVSAPSTDTKLRSHEGVPWPTTTSSVNLGVCPLAYNPSIAAQWASSVPPYSIA